MTAMSRSSLRLSSLALALVAAACGPKAKSPPIAGGAATGTAGAVPIPEGPPCPAADAVMIAAVHDTGPGAPNRWHLPLANRPSTATSPSYRVLDAAAASAAGVPAAPAKLWMMVNGTLCEATAGDYYSSVVLDGPANEILGVQLTTKCALPSNEQPQLAVAFAAEAAPTGCVSILPRPVAGRVGDDQNGRWSVLPQSTPIPDGLAAALPRKECQPPCEALWTVAQVDFGGKPVAWDATLEWLRVDPQQDACSWASEGDGGVYLAATGARLDDQHAVSPLHLATLLADRGGPKTLLLENVGEYTTVDLTAAPPRVARHLRWYLPNEELYAGDRKLGPYCGP